LTSPKKYGLISYRISCLYKWGAMIVELIRGYSNERKAVLLIHISMHNLDACGL
jgi:hypothetical protein